MFFPSLPSRPQVRCGNESRSSAADAAVTQPGAEDGSRSRRRGFSLIEVTLAMGIASFALLVIFSMLPTGLSSMENSGRQIAETEIFNRISAELVATPVYGHPVEHADTNDLLFAYTQERAPSTGGRFPAYFDIEGNELDSSKNAVFTVQCTVEAMDSKANALVWTPLNDSGLGELRWATVLIGFRKDPGTRITGTSTTPDPNVRKRTFLISNRGT